MRNKLIAAALMIWILSAGTAMAETLTLEVCIDTALEKHPDMVAAAAEVASKKAAVGQSAADSRPQVKLSSDGHWAWGATCWAAMPVAREVVQ